MKDKFYKCGCGHGGLHVEWSADWGCEFSHYQYDVCYSMWNRLRHAWKCLCGKPYSDMVLLNDTQVADLVDQLVEIQNREI